MALESKPIDLRPFHERWPQVLRYPLQPGPLSTLIAIAVAHVAVLLLLVVGPFLDLLVWAAFFKYAFEVLRWSANGRNEAPELSLTVSDAIGRYAVMVLILVELLLILARIWYGPTGLLLLGAALTLAMPAMMMILALEEGMGRALNPLAWLQLGLRLGPPYLMLAAFFGAALFVQSVVAIGIRAVLPWIVGDVLTYAVVNYLMIATFHLIGDMIHAHSLELGYAGHLELQEEVPHTDPARPILDAARERAASGDTQGAATLLREELSARPQSITLHDEYRHWLQHEEDHAALSAHGKMYIPVLLAQDLPHRAIDIARECLALDPAFQLDDGDDVTRLARSAAEAGQTQLALSLFAGFHKRFRTHPAIAGNYLIAAKLLAERMNREMQARALLQQIKYALPDDPAIPEVDAYLAFLDKLASTPARPAAPSA